ncbi:MAG: hypothetical protein ACR2HY_07645 [Acidimicrobiales bacterium]
MRELTDRWVKPMAGTVLSSHGSAGAAMDAFKHQPQSATDGTGQASRGNYRPTAVVRVAAGGQESIVLPPPAGGGLMAWPYSN